MLNDRRCVPHIPHRGREEKVLHNGIAFLTEMRHPARRRLRMMMCKILKEDRKGLIKNMEDENEIREKMIAIIREKARQCYSDRIVDYGTNPGNRGIIEDSDGYAEEKNECGGNIKMFLRVKGGKIEESRFVASGCIFTVAACNAATEMAKGKTIQDCLKINRRSIIAYLGGMPEDHAECAFLAALVFQRALRNYIVTNKKT